jgi:hypothetical protein
MKIAALAAAALTLFFASADCAAQWVTCAKEDGFCQFDGRREVAYGSGNRWVTKVFTNGVKCANSVFGDPAPGVAKTCRARDIGAAAAPAPAQWVECAKEDGFCRFDGKREVAYGSGEKWSVKWATNGVKCANSVFGDPAPQKAKICRVRVAAGQPAFSEMNASWQRCAAEGQDCRFDGTRKVAYGAGNRWHYRVARDRISCTSGIFGGDPAPNVVKACFLDPR